MAEIDLTHLTSATVDTDANDGNGIFDVLIRVVEKHIKEQYDNNRITGGDYATVYLGAMQSVLSQSVTFLLQEQQADKQADFLSEQIKSEIKNNEDEGVIELSKRQTQEEIDLVIARTASEYERVTASQANTARMDAESEEKIKLIANQALGFKVSGKQNLLKQMFEGYGIEATTLGQVNNPPTVAGGAALETVAKSIFEDLGGDPTSI